MDYSKIQYGDTFYFINMDGSIESVIFDTDNVLCISLMYVGNIFKTKEEAQHSSSAVLDLMNTIKNNRINLRTGDGL